MLVLGAGARVLACLGGGARRPPRASGLTSTTGCSITVCSSTRVLPRPSPKVTHRETYAGPGGADLRRHPLPCPRSATPPPAPPPTPSSSWNQFLLGLQATPGAQPATVQPTYELAVMHAAIYDAVVADRPQRAPVPPAPPRAARRLPRAAADAAAHDTLAALYPAQRAQIDQQYAAELAKVPGGRAQAEGVAVGRAAPRRCSRARAQRRLDRDAAAVHARHAARRLPADAAGIRAARVHPLVEGAHVRAALARASSARRRRRRITSPKYQRGAGRGAGARRRRPARRARPTRRRSACSGTRRSGRPGTASPRPRRSAPPRRHLRRRAHVRRAEPRRSPTR